MYVYSIKHISWNIVTVNTIESLVEWLTHVNLSNDTEFWWRIIQYHEVSKTHWAVYFQPALAFGDHNPGTMCIRCAHFTPSTWKFRNDLQRAQAFPLQKPPQRPCQKPDHLCTFRWPAAERSVHLWINQNVKLKHVIDRFFHPAVAVPLECPLSAPPGHPHHIMVQDIQRYPEIHSESNQASGKIG